MRWLQKADRSYRPPVVELGLKTIEPRTKIYDGFKKQIDHIGLLTVELGKHILPN